MACTKRRRVSPEGAATGRVVAGLATVLALAAVLTAPGSARATPTGAEGVVVVAACDDRERATQIHASVRAELGETFVPREDLPYGDVPLSVRIGEGCDRNAASVEVIDARTGISFRRELSLSGTPERLRAHAIALAAVHLVGIARFASSPSSVPGAPAEPPLAGPEGATDGVARATPATDPDAGGGAIRPPPPPNPYFDHVPYAYTEERPGPKPAPPTRAPYRGSIPPPPNPYFDHVPYDLRGRHAEAKPELAMCEEAPVESAADNPYALHTAPNPYAASADDDGGDDDGLLLVPNPYAPLR